MKNNFSRRDFIVQTAARAATAGAGVLVAASTAKALGANGRLRVGLIGAGSRCQAHLDILLKLEAEGKNVEAAAVCDVFNKNRNQTASKIREKTGRSAIVSGDYRDLIDRPDLDVLVVATPNHWHARMTIDALAAGKHVYCEKPMTHTIPESQAVLAAWKASGRVMQVGCQRTSDGRWHAAHEWIVQGKIGKVLQAQTEYYRNSSTGQWRYHGLSRDMTPKNIDWRMFLGTDFGLAPEMPFDRAAFAQWRCYWPFGSGLFSDLFVHRLTELNKAMGLRFPRRVVGSGGIFLEYDGRDVPDTATVIADYDEGCQLFVTATLGNDHPLEPCIRGHFGTLTFDLSKDGFNFIPQRPQVTRLRESKPEHISAYKPKDETYAHWENFLEAIRRDDPQFCNNPPDLGAAAVVTAMLGAESYRQGKVLEWNADLAQVKESGPQYASHWESLSRDNAAPRQVLGWQPDVLFQSRQKLPDYQKLSGPWTDGKDPAV